MGLSLFVSQVCQAIHILRDLFSYQDGQATPGGRAEEPILEERARRRAIHSKQGMLYIPLFLSQKISLRINALHCRRMLNVSLIFFIIKESCSFTISKKRKKEPCSFIWCILIIVYCPCRISYLGNKPSNRSPTKWRKFEINERQIKPIREGFKRGINFANCWGLSSRFIIIFFYNNLGSGFISYLDILFLGIIKRK